MQPTRNKLSPEDCEHKPLKDLNIDELSINQTVACSDCWEEFKVRVTEFGGDKYLYPKRLIRKWDFLTNLFLFSIN